MNPGAIQRITVLGILTPAPITRARAGASAAGDLTLRPDTAEISAEARARYAASPSAPARTAAPT